MLHLSLLDTMLSQSIDAKGGGEILQIDSPDVYKTIYVNWDLVKQYNLIPFILLGAVIVAIIACCMYNMKLNNITAFSMYGISYSINRRKRSLKRQSRLIAVSQFIQNWTQLVERSPFRCNKNNKDYMDYNLKRAGIALPGNQPMYLEQYNALKFLLTVILIGFSIAVALFVNTSIGVLMIIVVSWAVITLPTTIIRFVVEHKDSEIKNHFMDFYLILHYSLLMGSSTPLPKLMQSYVKTTDSAIMHQFVAECVNTIDTYGEYNATEIISKDFREVAQVGKLMRMIKQQFDGADVKQELIGFRAELIRDERYRISERGDKKVQKVKASLGIVYIFLIQVIISVMAIYLPDLGGIGGLMGG